MKFALALGFIKGMWWNKVRQRNKSIGRESCDRVNSGMKQKVREMMLRRPGVRE